jgi:hypothetical protein
VNNCTVDQLPQGIPVDTFSRPDEFGERSLKGDSMSDIRRKAVAVLAAIVAVVGFSLSATTAASADAAQHSRDGAVATQTVGDVTVQDNSRECGEPARGAVCFYADTVLAGWSISRSACGGANFPRWFWDYTSAWWDKQTGGAWASADSFTPSGGRAWLFNTQGGGVAGNVPWPVNDQADWSFNHC